MRNTDVIERWLDVLEGRADARGRPLRNYGSSANVWGRGSTLYSYGRHFPLCEHYPAGRGRRRPLFLLNGDRRSVSTSRHQADTRGAVLRRAHPNGSANPVADVLIVPFSALAAAGILHSTILPLEIRPDRWETLESRPVPVDLSDTSTATRTLLEHSTWFDYSTSPPERRTRPYLVHRWDADGYAFTRAEYGPEWGDHARLADYANVVEWPDGAPRELSRDMRTLYRRRHLLGDSLFTAATQHERTVTRPVTVRDVVSAAVRSIDLRRHGYSGVLDVCETLDNVDIDEPIRETVTVRRRRRYVSSFDANEPAPLYFLATLPGSSRARTVESAILDLAPPAVHAAIARGRHVERQGDIFAIETDTHDAALAGYPRARLTLWTRGARPRPGEPGYAAPFTAAERRRIVHRARALWRARWTELQRGYAQRLRPENRRDYDRRRAAAHRAAAVRNLEHARRAARRAVLVFEAPAYVPYGRSYGYRVAESRDRVTYYRAALQTARLERVIGRDTYRHGRSLVPQRTAAQLWGECVRDAEHELRPALRPANADRARARVRELLSIHGTAHTATEVVRAPGGRTYIRDSMVHAPGLEPGARFGRERDHVRRPLKPGVWYLAVRNTVPRQSSDTRGPQQ